MIPASSNSPPNTQSLCHFPPLVFFLFLVHGMSVCILTCTRVHLQDMPNQEECPRKCGLNHPDQASLTTLHLLSQIFAKVFWGIKPKLLLGIFLIISGPIHVINLSQKCILVNDKNCLRTVKKDILTTSDFHCYSHLNMTFISIRHLI